MVSISTKYIDLCNTVTLRNWWTVTDIATAGTITTTSVTKRLLCKPSYSQFSAKFLNFRRNGNRGQSSKNLTNIV